MKHKGLYLSILVFFTLFAISACSFSRKAETASSSFAIYLVEDDKTIDALSKNINDLKLEEEPIITDQNIILYEWTLHRFTLNKDEKLQKVLDDKVYMKVPTDGKPFVLMCDGERIYVGAFWTSLSSLSAPNCPIIISDYSDNDFLQIDYILKDGDTRNDERVHKVLERIEKLK